MYAKFEIGKLTMTAGIAERSYDADEHFSSFVISSFERYLKCDWGDMSEEDKKANDEAVKYGDSRILAAYVYPQTGEKIWIITEADRSYTTILFPEEY